MAQTLYCNTTTDLFRAYSKIHEAFKGLRTIKGYKPYTTANVYKFSGCGYVEAMYEDGTLMTSVASIALTNSAQKWYYDSTNDVLYFYPTGGVPDNHTYLAGENFDTVKTDAVKTASRDAEAILDNKFSVPIPMSPSGSTTEPYDKDLIHAVALRACGHIMSRTDPAEYDASGTAQNVAAKLLNAGEKILQEYNEGKRSFSWELTADKIGTATITPTSTNTSGGVVQVRGEYQSDSDDYADSSILSSGGIALDPFWKLKIAVTGVVGTATYQISLDNGTTYETAVATSSDWAELSNNIWVRFLPYTSASTFVLNDTWTIEVSDPTRSTTRSQIKSRPVIS